MSNKNPDYINPEYSFDSVLNSGMIDELPLWSAPFGLKLLDMIEYRKNMKVLDIGFGSGFPLIEIAQRLGKSSLIYGVDPWNPSHLRVKQKIKFLALKNIVLFRCPAESIPLNSDSLDLVVSNNGINNVQDVNKALNEISRVCKKNAQFISSMNLPGTMKEFYDKFVYVLRKHNMNEEIEKVKTHIKIKRKSLMFLQNLYDQNGFIIKKIYRSKFFLKFADAEAFFNHSLIKIGFIKHWRDIIPTTKVKIVFEEIMSCLDKDVSNKKGIIMSVPFVVFNCYKK